MSVTEKEPNVPVCKTTRRRKVSYERRKSVLRP